MPKSTQLRPRFCTHTCHGDLYAYTRVDGRRLSLGRAGSPEALSKYQRIVAEWDASETERGLAEPSRLTVAELAERFVGLQWQRVEDGEINRMNAYLANYAATALVENAEHANTPVNRFGPKALRAIQRRLAKTPAKQSAGCFRDHSDPPCLSRSEVNRRMNTIRVVTLMSRSDDELGHPVYEPYRTFISAGIVADRGAAKNFMAELGSMCEAAEYLGGEDTKCHPECYCQCVDQYRDRLSACAATFIVCIEASLVYLVGGIAVCAIGCMAGGPLWQPCLMACLRMVAMKKIKQILGACMAAYGACKMIQDEFLVGCSNDC